MSLSLLTLLLFLLFSLYYIVYKRAQTLNVMKRRIAGIDDILFLRRLLEYIPQHRGMANALLLGDESFQAKILTLDQKIDKEVSSLAVLIKNNDRWIIAEGINKFKTQWAHLKKDLNHLQPADSFKLHTELVTILLHLIDDVGDAANILTTQDAVYTKLADAALRKLPLMTEMLGQARGMGTGVASKGQCDANMRVKLTYLLDTARQVANDVCVEVKSALASEKKLEQKASKVLKDNQQATELFLKILENNIIGEKNITVSSTDYYGAGTEAIKHAFALLDNITNSMRNNLQSFAGTLSNKLLFIKFFTATISVTAIFFYMKQVLFI